MSLTLIGYRATGKTTLAQCIAERLGWDWIDADVEIERRAGKSIARIFAEDGEPAFRDLEVEVTVELCRRDRIVLAAGGGAPMRDENRRAMNAAGPVVWLKARPETILARMSGDATTAGRRPDLTDRGGLAEIVELLQRREPIYREVADLEIDTEGKTLDVLATEILDRLPAYPPVRVLAVNLILAIPIEVRIVCLFLLGAVLGSLANWAAYRLAWNRRSISPWSAADPAAPRRIAFDRVPVFGWLSLQREAGLHGRGFWIRPMVVELAAAFGLAWLYHWEVTQAGLLAIGTPRPVPDAWQGMLHLQFVAHALLIWLMLAASLIDLDEKTIPDSITVPGTLVGLLIAALFPLSPLPDQLVRLHRLGPPMMDVPRDLWQIVTARPELWKTMTFNSPCATTGWPDGFPLVWTVAVALGCWWLWCFALLRRDWYTRHGLGRALQLCMARVARDPSTVRIGLLAVAGTLAVVVVWFVGGRPWISLLTALIGMAVAGGLVWAVRIIGAAVLRREAMGFGDVTLMAMIGVYVGWQASILIFFLAPLAAVAIGLVVLVVCRDNVIPYGPFLCLATLFVVLGWASVWEWAGQRFDPDWLVPGVMGGCLVMLAVLLALVQLVKRLARLILR